jgi:dihydroxyacetone kinase-like protein
MVRGVRSLREELPDLPENLGKALLKCAQAFTKTSGSTFGTLLATGLMSAAKATKGRMEIPWKEVSSLFGAALASMSKRGKSQPGDKTVLDAVAAIHLALQGLEDPTTMLMEAEQAVTEALTQLRNQPARKGRARIFANKSIGCDDPGMVVFKYMIESLKSHRS